MAKAPLTDCLAAYGTLEAPQRRRLAAIASRRARVRRRTDLLRQGESTCWLPVVERGWLEHARLLADGRRCLVRFSLPGDLVDSALPAAGRPQFTVTAVSEARVTLVDGAGFLEALEGDSAIARAFMNLQAAEQSRARERAVVLARMDAYERLGDVCLDLLSRLEVTGQANGGGFDLPVSQRSLGEFLGLHAVHVNRMFQRMEADGFIVRNGSHVRVVDRQGLAELAAFRPRHGTHALRAGEGDESME